MPVPRIPPCAPARLTIASTALRDGAPVPAAQVFNDWGAEGENIAPDLRWSAGPDGTACYAVTCFDPDAPTGSGFWHWAVLNIPAEVTGLEAGEAAPPGAVVARNDYGFAGYGGPCPPVGDGPHRYIFTVYALRAPGQVPPGCSGAVAAFTIHALKLAEGSLTATYAR
jgi:Raf kinase inhibitor-like YbhB/YbcL family protein